MLLGLLLHGPAHDDNHDDNNIPALRAATGARPPWRTRMFARAPMICVVCLLAALSRLCTGGGEANMLRPFQIALASQMLRAK